MLTNSEVRECFDELFPSDRPTLSHDEAVYALQRFKACLDAKHVPLQEHRRTADAILAPELARRISLDDLAKEWDAIFGRP